MPNYRTTTYAQRVEMVERHQAGESYHRIAFEMTLNYYTVRKWNRVFRDGGWEAVCPPTDPSAGILSQFNPLVRYVALRIKRQHPGWGADKILLEMSRRPSLHGIQLPKRSTLARYIQSFAPRLQRHRPLRTERPTPSSDKPQAVHVCWQMDFKGEEQLGAVGKVKPFMVCDAYSSAPLASIIHSGQRGGITMRDVQHDLRQVFCEWGLPVSIRMDRDPLWVGSSRLEFPGLLLLWFVGLDVSPVINRAHRPTDNAQIERCNGIWVDHVARGQTYETLEEVQDATDGARQDRLQHLPSRNPQCKGQAPLVALPQLAQARITYTPDLELILFDMARVYHYLSQWQWQRSVDSTGQLSLGGYNRRIGKQYAGQVVKVRFEPHLAQFTAFHLNGNPLASFSLPSITAEVICGTGMLE